MASGRRSFWGWGEEGAGLDASERERLGLAIAARLGGVDLAPVEPPRLEELRLPAARCAVPTSLAPFVSQEPYERAAHTYGKAFRDVVRALARDFAVAPDAVATPASETELEAVLAWCESRRLAAIPYGGGSSVVGGVEARVGPGWNGAVSVDLRRLAAVLEVDRTSRAARIQAGIYGPALERALRGDGLTLRHFPQSFEHSTLGGWIATRAAGHYATLHTRVDDFVESLRVLTPRGVVETRRVPSSGAGPAPERLFIGSEGTLGIILDAWVRLQARPRHRASAIVRFDDFLTAAEAVRRVVQAGLHPASCRVLDAEEALHAGAGDGTAHLLLLGFESADHPLDAPIQRALALCRDAGGRHREDAGRSREVGEGDRDGEAGSWRSQFLRAPYVRDALATLGLVVETFETAVTWDRFPELHGAVLDETRAAAARVCGAAVVTCRLTHAYPDGVAPYYTVIAAGGPGSRIVQWDELKAAASEAILAQGGTITHHHGVGRDHRPWYDRERPDPFAAALRAAKQALDPIGILNPGVLLGA